jgi:hypothetical protein
MAVHFHLVQLERRHNRHDVDAAEEACERYQPQSPPEQGVVKHHRIELGVRLGIDHNIPLSAMYICTLNVLYSYRNLICTCTPHEFIRSLTHGQSMSLRETVKLNTSDIPRISLTVSCRHGATAAYQHSLHRLST